MSEKNKLKLDRKYRQAEVDTTALSEDNREITLRFTAGGSVKRYGLNEKGQIERFIEDMEVSEDSIVADRFNAGNAPLLNSHRTDDLRDVIGRILPDTLKVSEGVATVKAKLTEASDAAPIMERLRDGTVRAVSFGYEILEMRKDGKRDGLPVYTATKYEPSEVSFVPVAADTGAGFSEGESRNLRSCDLISTEIQSKAVNSNEVNNNLNKEIDDMSDSAKKETKNDEGNLDIAPIVNLDDVRKDAESRGVEKYKARQKDLDAIAKAVKDDDFVAKYRDNDVSIEDIRKEAFEMLANRDSLKDTMTAEPVSPSQVKGTSEDFKRAAISTMLTDLNPNLYKKDDNYSEELRGKGLVDIARMTLDSSGVSTSRMGNNDIIDSVIRGQLSTSDFPNLLGEVNNRILAANYELNTGTFQQWTSSRSVNDYRSTTVVQIGEVDGLQKLRQGERIKSADFPEAAETFKVDPYGRRYDITEEMMINDDLGAITQLIGKFGAISAQAVNRAAYQVLLTNPTMNDKVNLFASSRNNFVDAGGTITVDSVGDMFQSFAKQTSLEGKNSINVTPAYILTGVNQTFINAQKIFADYVPNQADEVNPYRGRVQIISDAEISNSGSATELSWYGVANPAILAGVQISYLRGQTQPRVVTQADPSNRSIANFLVFSFGADAIDPRALYRNDGK